MLSTHNKNLKILALTFSALIVGVEAQKGTKSGKGTKSVKAKAAIVTLNPSYPDCYWVVRSWQQMGQTIPSGISPNDNSCCTASMYGVYCDSTNKVTGVDWSFKSLTGSIPAEIGNLTSLISLFLNNNQLNGSIPAQIGNLVNLAQLALSINKLSGQVPAEIGNLKSLISIDLNNNQLNGSIPADIGEMKNLTLLDVSSNFLTGTFRINCDSGMVINVQGNQVTLGDCQVTCIATSPQCCWVLRSWRLMGKTIPTGIKSSDNSCCTLPMDGVTCDSTKTKVISINWSWWSLNPNSNLGLPGRPGYLGHLQLKGAIPASIGNLKNLTYLNLYRNQLNGPIPAEIGNLTSLTSLDLSSNQLSGPIPAEIGNLKNLNILYLQYNQLNVSIPSDIGNLKNMTELYLFRNRLSGQIPSTIGNLTKLQTLYLFDNRLSGSIPAEVGNLKSLTWIDLKNNTLSGSIPAEIGNLTSLTALHLGWNQLSGLIPAEIGKLVNLTWLFFQNNLLSGTFIPLCDAIISATNTSLTLCGCATSGSPANLFPPAGTSLECLSTGPATTPLAKRALVFSQNIRVSDKDYKYTCNNDTFGNPYQDCLNAQGAICHTDYIGTNSTRLDECKKGVDKMTRGLSYHWQNVRRACGQWSFDGAVMGPYNPSNCETANIALQQNAFYLLPDGTKGPVTSLFTNSVTAGLWSNIK